MTKQNKPVDPDVSIDHQYGKRGAKDREAFEEGYEGFKLGAILRQMRREQNLTQE